MMVAVFIVVAIIARLAHHGFMEALKEEPGPVALTDRVVVEALNVVAQVIAAGVALGIAWS